jgi:RecA/RadA recombinase
MQYTKATRSAQQVTPTSITLWEVESRLGWSGRYSEKGAFTFSSFRERTEVQPSSSGKTQLALQLSLLVQLPKNLGGLSGSVCYLTTSSKLPTSRLVQISENHPLLSPSLCGLADIHTLATPTVPILIHVLSKILPPFINNRQNDFHSKPVKILVIDALAELFHLNIKTTTSTLVERSRDISEISTLLHTLASTYQLAVVVLNEVVDAFDQGREADGRGGDLVYSDQSRWFNQADSVPGENRKQASLGLVWANQVNARILLSRTGRRRYLGETQYQGGKHRNFQSRQNSVSSRDQPVDDDQATEVRRLSVIFSSISPPVSLDYTVTMEGISILDPRLEIQRFASSFQGPPPAEKLVAIPDLRPLHTTSQISPLDVGVAEDGRKSLDPTVEGSAEDEQGEWETHWNADVILEDLRKSVDGDAFENTTTEPRL